MSWLIDVHLYTSYVIALKIDIFKQYLVLCSSPEGNLPVERKVKSKWEFQRTARQRRTKMNDVSIQASASVPQIKLVHRRTQTSATFTVTHSCSRWVFLNFSQIK